MKIGIILFSNSIGGTERRFCNLLKYLTHNSKNNSYVFFINRSLTKKLHLSGHLEGLENILYKLPITDGLISRFVDSKTDIFSKMPFHIPGPNRIIQLVKNQMKNIYFTITDKKIINSLDLIHYAGPYGWKIINSDAPSIQEGQDTALGFIKNTISKKRVLSSKNITNCATDSIKKRIIQELPEINSNNLEVIPCYFTDYSKIKIQRKKKIVSFVGRFIKEKNPDLFIDAIKHIVIKRHDISFEMIGDGRENIRLLKRIKKLGIGNYINTRFHSNPSELLSRSMIFVSLQKTDNYHSQALLEAMACGCAIIASDVGETSKIVNESVGIRIPFDSTILSEKIIELIDQPEKCIQMGIKAREKVLKDYTVESYSMYLKSIYKKAFQIDQYVIG